jgi:hypothetical protein
MPFVQEGAIRAARANGQADHEARDHALCLGASATETPASCSFKIPIICSSEKRLRFILWSSSWARANFNLD